MAIRVGQHRFAVLLAGLLTACGSSTPPGGVRVGGAAGHGAGATGGGIGTGGGNASGNAPQTFQASLPVSAIGNNVDLLFVIDDSSAMTNMQAKLGMLLPTFFQELEGFTGRLPNLHIAVVSSDMGAPGDSTATLGCTATGDGGQFQARPRGSCTSTPIADKSTFLSDVAGQQNFTGDIATALQCLGLLGATGCAFQQPLAAIARALGTDGAPPPAGNLGFLRPNALLGLFVLTDQDDCSAPADTTIFSLNGGPQSITNPDGPLTRYRCNGGPRGGHLCVDPATGQTLVPPLTPPPDATGSPPILDLSACRDNDSGSSALTPVGAFVQQIEALKPDPDHQIAVTAILGASGAYNVEWVPPYASTSDGGGLLWPQIMHACGPTRDGSTGDPAVRASQFVEAFANGAQQSICDSSYAQALSGFASRLAGLIPAPSCLMPPGTIQTDAQGYPACTVVRQRIDGTGKSTTFVTPNCNENGGAAPCWTLASDGLCPSGGLTFALNADQADVNAASLTATLDCSLR